MLPPAEDAPPPPPPPAPVAPAYGAHQPRPLSADGAYEWDGIQWVPRGYATPNRYSYRPARARATVALSLFPLWAIATLVSVVVEVQRLSLVNTALSGVAINPDDATASDHAVQLTSGLTWVVYVPLIIAFLMWLHRVVANNWALGAQGLKFTPGWAVGWWFIPFANFVQPERVVEETWRVTSTPRPSTPMSRHDVGAVAIVRWWWAFWLLGALGGRLFVYASGDTLSVIQINAILAIVTSVFSLVAAALAFRIVRSLTARQERLAG